MSKERPYAPPDNNEESDINDLDTVSIDDIGDDELDFDQDFIYGEDAEFNEDDEFYDDEPLGAI